MRKWSLAALLSLTAHAAVIRGTVVENLTGHPLSRASVLLEPVPGSKGTRMVAKTNRFGFFEFAGEPAGIYLMQANREAFVPALYGQKRWNSSGVPMVLTESETPFVTIRMLHYGAIAGTVVDENDVGMPEVDVVAYLNTRPPQLAAKATSDEKGVYRIYGLLPGNYIVRTAGKQVEDIGYKPTYAKETDIIDQAKAVDVEIEEQVNLVNVRPLPGKLFSLSAGVQATDPCCKPVTMTFASETGRQIIHTPADAVSRIFTGLPVGDYEIFGEAPSDTPAIQADYQRLSLGRDSVVSLPLRKIGAVRIQIDGAPMQSVTDGSVKVLARRKDLAGTYDMQTIKPPYANLAAGVWEFALAPLEGYYASGFSGSAFYFGRSQRAEGWNETTVNGNGASIRFTVSKNVASMHGIVKDAGEPVAGAPVFLEPMELEPARRVTFTYVALTDTHGKYQFSGLAPGRYRLLSSFEYRMPDAKIMGNAGAKDLQLDARTDAARDLDLYVIR